jgi:hypothetical protein
MSDIERDAFGGSTTDRPPLPLLLHGLTPVVRPAMLELFNPDCAIATCAILRKVFSSFGYDAVSVATSVQIYNANMIRLLQAKLHMPDDMEERLALFEKEIAWGIGFGIGDPMVPVPVGFDGHVVIRLGKTLVDASLEQADRIKHNIVLGPMIACEPGEDFFESEDLPEYAIHGRTGCVVVYRRILDETYKDSIDWIRWSTWHDKTLEKIINQTTERMIDVL